MEATALIMLRRDCSRQKQVRYEMTPMLLHVIFVWTMDYTSVFSLRIKYILCEGQNDNFHYVSTLICRALIWE